MTRRSTHRRPWCALFTGFALLVGLFATVLPGVTEPAVAGSTGITLTDFQDMAVDPATGLVFVSGDNSVFVFEPDGSPRTTIPDIYGAAGMDITGSYLWVAETTTGNLTQIDIASLSVRRQIATGVTITGHSLAVIGFSIWFTSNTTWERYDLLSNTLTARGTASREFERVGSSTTMMLGYDIGGTTVTTYNLGTNPVSITAGKSVASNLRQVAVDSGAGRFVVAAASPSVFLEGLISPLTLTGLQYPGANYPAAVAFSPGNGGVVAGSTQSAKTLFVSAAGSPVTVTKISLGGDQVSRALAVSPDGQRVYALTQPTSGVQTTKQFETYDIRPSVSTVLPTNVVADVPTDVTVFGANIGAISGATLGGIPADWTYTANGQLIVTTPVGVPVGTAPLVLTTAFGSSSFTMTILPNTGASVIGTVTNGTPPAPGIEVTVTAGALGSPRTTTTAADGTYTFSGLPYGTDYRVAAHDPTGNLHDRFEARVHVVPNGTTTVNLNLAASPSGPGGVIATSTVGTLARDVATEPASNRVFVSAGDDVYVFDHDGQPVGRIHDMWGAEGLAVDAGKVYVNLRTARKVARIDGGTLDVTGMWATNHPTTGSLAAVAGRVWFTNGDTSWVSGLTSLDPSTGTLVDSNPASMYAPQLRPIPGSALLYATDYGLSPPRAHIINAANAQATLVQTVASYGGLNAATATVNRLWTTGGIELVLSTMTSTGVVYPNNNGPVSFSPGRGGVLAFGNQISRYGTAQATHVLSNSPVASAFDAGGDRIFYVTGAAFYAYDLHPRLTSVSPATIYTDTSPVTVSGGGLRTTSNVLVDGVTAPFTVTPADQLIVTTPVLTPGNHTLQVTTPWGTSEAMTFTAIVRPPVPTVTSVTPSTTPTGGGAVVIKGWNLTGATAVKFAGTSAAWFTVVDDSTINTFAPVHAVGSGSVAVTTPGGTNVGGPTFSWYAPTPTVTGLSLTQGSAIGGYPITISGSGFAFATDVTVAGTSVPFTVIYDGSISATMPPHAAGPVNVAVTTAGGTSSAVAASTFTYLPFPPQITSLSPTNGSAAGGYQVVIRGSRFTGATQVRFGGVASPSFVVLDDSTLVAVAPPGQIGVTTVLVSTSFGNSGDLGTTFFQYTAAPAGTIAGTVSSTQGPLVGMTVIVSPANSPAILASTTTAADGTFSVPKLPVGSYKVLVLDPGIFTGAASYHVGQFYDGLPGTLDTFASATIVSVSTNTTTTLAPIKLVHNHAASMHGHVTGGGGPLANMGVVISPAAFPYLAAYTFTDANGDFSFAGLTPGQYKMLILDPAPLFGGTATWRAEFYDNGSSSLDDFPTAMSITVDPDGSVTLNPIELAHL